VLPLVDVDFERLEEAEFRALLEALNFEARYDSRRKELAVSVVLVPELVGPDDGHPRSPLSFVPPLVHPTGQKSNRYPQVEGHVLRLSARHAKLRREGYRKREHR